MKKIISPLVLALLLIWTWYIVHAPSAIGFETHSGIQAKLVELIENTLKSKKPDAKDLEIIKIWTTSLDDNKVQASFAYRFTEPGEDNGAAKKTIQGEAVLHREPTEDPTIDKWVLQSVKSQLEALNYTESTEVLPTEDSSSETTAPEDKKEVKPETTAPAAATHHSEKPKENDTHE